MLIKPEDLRALLSVAQEFGATTLTVPDWFSVTLGTKPTPTQQSLLPASEVPSDEEFLFASSGFPVEKPKEP